MTQFAFIMPLLHIFAFAMIILFTRWKEKLSAGLAISMGVINWVIAVIILIERMFDHSAYEAYFHITSFSRMNFELGILVDPLTAVMLIVVMTVGTCVLIYSVGYMKDDPRFSRFFAYLSLFLFSMLGLVLANNFFMIFIFWELVGVSSYFLIGFWFEKKSAADAGKKAFITNRVGDFGFIIGLVMVGLYCGTFNYHDVFMHIESGLVPAGVVTAMAIFLFCGAVGKSAQFPLHVWLPDAMEGPTPVSALIHAATMVAAGVYMVARSMNIFAASADASMVVAIIGVTTSFMAATIGLVQNDIKRVLAYSTVSQLGYMVMALGLYGFDTAHGHHSAGYTAGTFHLMTHAFFKGLLFLGAGSVIHAVHTNDIQEMGGLYPKMKKTSITFIIASLSIAGIVPFAGFWSKDEIIASTKGHPIFMFLTLAIAFMTAFYMFRLCFLTFFGEPRDQHRFDHAHESPNSMTYPLVFLSILAVCAGWVGLPGMYPGFSSFVFHHEPHLAAFDVHFILMALVSLTVAGSGILLAWLMYRKGVISPDKMAARFKPLYTLLYNKYYIDEIYDAVIINPLLAFSRFMWTFDAGVVDGAVNGTGWLTMRWSDIKMWFDKWIVDGAVNGSGWVVRQGANILRFVQSGAVQFYALFAITMLVLAIVLKYAHPEWGWVAGLIIVLTALLVMFSRAAKANGEANSAEREK